MRHGNSIAREITIQKLYLYSLNPLSDDLISTDELANKYFNGVLEHLNEIDDSIKTKLVKWTIDQINRVDLAILRLAYYEIKYLKTPTPIVVSESLYFTELFSDKKNKGFIHKVIELMDKEINE